MCTFFAENDRSNGPLIFCENPFSGKILVCAQIVLNVPKIAQKMENYQKGSKKSEKITKEY